MEGLGKSSFGWSLSAPRSSVRFQPPLWIPKVCSFSLEECVEGRRYVGSCSCGKKKKKRHRRRRRVHGDYSRTCRTSRNRAMVTA